MQINSVAYFSCPPCRLSCSNWFNLAERVTYANAALDRVSLMKLNYVG